MLKRILLGLVAIIVVAVAIVLILAARQPDEFRIQRTATINAPAEKIVPHIEDFHQWSAWSSLAFAKPPHPSPARGEGDLEKSAAALPSVDKPARLMRWRPWATLPHRSASFWKGRSYEQTRVAAGAAAFFLRPVRQAPRMDLRNPL